MANKRVILFEDSEDYAAQVSPRLTAALADRGGEVVLVKHDGFPSLDKMLIEDAIYEELDGKKAFFCVADRDLTKIARGLSEEGVARACQASAVPECRYGRQRKEKDRERLLRLVRESAPFAIDVTTDDLDQFTAQVVDLFSGFSWLYDRLLALEPQALIRNSPETLLMGVLGKPNYESYAGLYGSPRLPDYREKLVENIDHEMRARFKAHALGYWLKQRIMAFPGLLLHASAAAAYLDISPTDFDEASVAAQFRDAVYDGPFAGANRYWWRPAIDKILLERKQNGWDIAKAALGRDPARSACSEDHAAEAHGSSARYYCIVKEQPVCDVHSVGGFQWMPAGADMARVRKSVWEQDEPWLNL